ncbi:(R)-mandelonitrile lyase 1-like [Cucumis melo var. makuwa]|uniref:(R)-mandelonitrile lyase 1-like n=1 Tax=Cucumis melo var. makuwa TaxID=1194695 RepID=A0A5A7UTI9_CUCMM|nr:(R)-mandelonitrile lyase 1-like [Cucumis melo var. makuwa]TYK30155.1 (R)-mandelonitrile lyase 1-like [Cucumis melo var. makuwa]
MRERENLSHDFFSLSMELSLDIQYFTGCILNEHIENDTLCKPDVDPTVVERPVVLHVVDNLIDDDDEQLSHPSRSSDNESRTMSSFLSGFEETDALFLEFGDKFNNTGGSSSVDDNSDETQPSLTPRRRQQSRLLKLERYVFKNGKILIVIALGAEKPISPHAIRFSQSNHGRTRLLDNSSLIIKVAGPSRFYNNDMSLLRNEPTPEGSKPVFGDEICKKVLSRRPGYSKGLGWGPKPKTRKSCASSSSTTFSQAREVEEAKVLIEQQKVELEEAKHVIKGQRRTLELHTQQMEEMNKMIEEMSRA